MEKIKNKKGKLISVYWFAILVIVAGGIVLMVNTFYSNPYDIREIEANILSAKVADCIYFGGEINDKLMNGESFREDFQDTFLEKCSLSFETGKELETPPYYTEAEFFLEGNLQKTVFTLSAGNKNWKPDCEIDVNERDTLAVCSEKEFYMRTKQDTLYLVKITSILGKNK